MEYVTEDDENLIRRWYQAQGEDVQARFDYILQEILRTTDVTDCSFFKAMQRQDAGLWEIIIEVQRKEGKRHFRPVGFWDADERQFILVDGCQKSGRSTVPPGVFRKALDLRNAFLNEGRGKIREHII